MALQQIGVNRKEAGSLKRNPQIEAFLRERHVRFDLIEQVSIANIDVEGSLHNQARLGNPLNMENVRKLVEALRKGAVTPPVLVKRLSNGMYLVLDGNHRVAAHKELELPIDVYECEGRDDTLTLIMYEANTLHGLPTNEEDRTAAALFLVDQGFSLKDAAQRMLVPVASVRRANAAIEADRRAQRVQIDPRLWDRLPDSTKLKLASIDTDEAFDAAAKLAVEAGMRTDAINRFVIDLNRETSIKQKFAMIDAKREELMEDIEGAVVNGTSGRKGPRSAKARLNMIAGQLKSLGDPGQLAATIPAPERDTARERITETQDFLTKVLEALGE